MPEPMPQGRMLTGCWVTQMIYVAAKLRVPDRLADGPKAAP